MKKEYDDQLTPEVREKMKKNLVYIGIFSIIMIFAGLTSAYLVSMGDTFWVKFDFPPAFYVSTVFLLLSSIVLEIGIRMGRKGSVPATKILIPFTFVLGLCFCWFQWKGYGQLVDRGAYATGKILVTQGRYGDFYQLKIDGKYMEVNANDYFLAGKRMTEAQKKDVSEFARQFEHVDSVIPKTIKGYGTKYVLLYKNEEVRHQDTVLIAGDSTKLLYTDLRRLVDLAGTLRDGRGDFFMKGEMGKDFHIFYKGKELEYINRDLYYNGGKLSPPLQLKINSSADTATSFLYLITILHFLHILATMIYMLRMSIRSFTGKLATHDYLAVRMGAIFWHFLGLLWGYLLLFLLFIH